MKTEPQLPELSIPTLSGLQPAAAQFLRMFPDSRVFAFYGAMGAGKTTFIRSVCHELGILENVSSPTFALVNEYRRTGGEPLYHFDFYRIRDEKEAVDIGCEEYFYSGHYCFIEWPEKILNLLPLNHVPVFIRVLTDDQRLITFYA